MLSAILNNDPPPPAVNTPSSPSVPTSAASNGAGPSSIHRSPLHNVNSLSPTKRPRSPPELEHAPHRSNPNTPSRTAIGNLVNSSDQLPRTTSRVASPAVTPSGDTIDDADATMAIDEQLRAVEDDDRQHEPIVVDNDDDEDVDDDEDDDEEEDDDEDSEDDEEDDSDDDIIALDGPQGAEIQLIKTEPTEGKPTDQVDSTKDGEDDAQALDEKKPKKKKRRERSPSSDEDLAPPPPPMKTIRLEVELLDDDMLDWNFLQEAAKAGYDIYDGNGEPYVYGDDVAMQENGEGPEGGVDDLPEGTTPGTADPFAPPGFANEQAEAEAIAARLEAKFADYGKSKKKKALKPTKSGRRRPRELYDLTDEFIDDSEVYIDRPTHVARPKKEGFFVHAGHLELMEEEGGASRRPKSSVRKGVKTPRESRPPLSAALREKYKPKDGDPAIVVVEDGPGIYYRPRSPSPPGGDPTGGQINRALFKNAPREEKYLPPFDYFPDEVAHALRKLRHASSNYPWDVNNKGRFPEELKEPLKAAGEAAFHYDLLCVVDKEPTDTRYEDFKEKAFVQTLCGMLPYNRLTLGKLVLKTCYSSYWKWLLAIEEEGLRQWREVLEPHLQEMEEDWEKQKREHEEKQGQQEIVDETGDKNKNELKRIPYFAQDPDLKDIFRQLVENTQEQVEVNKKMEEWGQPIQGQSSELNMRKLLYNKIIKLYPGEFMTSLHLSRQFTNYKRSGQGAAAAAAAKKEELGEH